jgi:hypothetical protein
VKELRALIDSEIQMERARKVKEEKVERKRLKQEQLD